MQVSELAIYPIKSCRGIALTQGEVFPKGFLWDREFVITDPQGKFLTQRQFPQLATLEVAIQEERVTLSVSNSAIAPLTFSTTLTGPMQVVEVWGDRTPAIDQGERVAEWLDAALAFPFPVHLFRQSPQHIRPIDPTYAQQENLPVSFSDGYPFLLTNTASLEELNRRLHATYGDTTQNVSMNRFRANIVITSDQPFIEDQWQHIQVGSVGFKVVKPCSRCLVTTTDQKTGHRNPFNEPLKTLNQFRNWSGKLIFGQNLIPQQSGIIQVGDPVTIIA